MTEMTALDAVQRFITLAEQSLVGAKDLAASETTGSNADVANTIALAQVNATLAVASGLVAIDERLRTLADLTDRNASEIVDELGRIRHSIDVS